MPLEVGGVLADLGRPRACAVWVDWAAAVEAASPWVDFIIARRPRTTGTECPSP